MKKKLVAILALCVAVCLVVGIILIITNTNNDNKTNNDNNDHVHEYNQQITTEKYLASKATCEQKAKYCFSCECGEKGTETFEYGELVNHDYGDFVSNGDGTHTKTCKNNNSHTVTENCSGGTATVTNRPICEQCGSEYGSILRMYTREGNYIYFGRYPQTIKEDLVIISGEANSDGYYLGSDGELYAKVVADAYDSGYKFSTGTEIIDGMTYYFKVEPLRWKILSTDEVTATIYCDSVIESGRYDDNSNNYKDSEIRAWLNDQFLNTAFTELEKEIIKITTVDNSVYSTGFSSNSNVCENTEDKIFLLSYREAMQIFTQYRQIQTSDYARSTYTLMSTNTNYYGSGYWWDRSPFYLVKYAVGLVNYNGEIQGSCIVSDEATGVVPALQIQL